MLFLVTFPPGLRFGETDTIDPSVHSDGDQHN